MTVLFDAEALLAFAFDEPGAEEVQRWLDRVYDGELDGYATTVNLAEFRYVASREASAAGADAHVEDLRDIGVREYGIDDLWRDAAAVKARYNPSLADAYAIAAASDLDAAGRTPTLLVGADDDYDVFEDDDRYAHLIEQFRDQPE